MIRPVDRVRFVKEESGFTLSEMMVTIVIMIVVLFALFSIFDMTIRVFAYGNNKAEAMESARLGLEKMEREIRGAYKYNSGASQNHLFFDTASPTVPLTVPPTTVSELTFGNEMGGPGAGNGVIECGTPCEYITYELTNANGTATCAAAPCTLWRENGSTNSGPVVENVPLNGLTFTLLQSDGATLATDESDIGIVLVSLDIVVDEGTNTEGTQTLTTAIDLRNRL